MDWTSFFFGTLAGSFATLAALTAVAWRWMRPFMRAAQRKAERAASGETTTPRTSHLPWEECGNTPTDWPRPRG